MTVRPSTLLMLAMLALATPARADAFDDALGAYIRNDFAIALKGWTALAEQGNANARNNIGIMYEKGEGTPQSYEEAFKWYKRAAEQGHTDAQLNLGVLYDKGLGVAQDPLRAYMWFDISASRSLSGMTWGGLGALGARNAVAAKMTPEQVAQAKEMARKCVTSGYWECD